jgi:hypothetical protein
MKRMKPPSDQDLAQASMGGYDKEIIPLLKKVVSACRQYGYSLVSMVETFPKTGTFATAFDIQPGASFAVRLVQAAMMCGGNVDLLVANIAKYVAETGVPHQSMVLNDFCGVAANPADRKPPSDDPDQELLTPVTPQKKLILPGR